PCARPSRSPSPLLTSAPPPHRLRSTEKLSGPVLLPLLPSPPWLGGGSFQRSSRGEFHTIADNLLGWSVFEKGSNRNLSPGAASCFSRQHKLVSGTDVITR